MSLRKASYLKWVLDKDPGKEHVTLGSFVRHFSLSDRQSATDAYLQLIGSNSIRKDRREKLQRAFSNFQKHQEDTFWSQRRLEISSEITANDAGVTSQKIGRIQSQVGYSRFLSSSSGYLFDDSLDNTEDKGERMFSLSHTNLLDDNSDLIPDNIDFTADDHIPIISPETPVMFSESFSSKRKQALEDPQRNHAEDKVNKKKKKADTKFVDSARRSLQRRHSSLGTKWTLRSGTIVENVLYEAGQELTVHHPIHSFMVDILDPYTAGLFSEEDWAEIKEDLPRAVPYASATSTYMDTFDAVKTVDDLRMRLSNRPSGLELELVYMCLQNWLNLYEMTSPSPFAIEGSLSESWWMSQAWGVCSQLTKGVPGCFILTGDMTGVDSMTRRNNKERLTDATPQLSRKKMGVRADLIWRSMLAPEKDWAIGEAARTWDELGQKFIHESTFKLPRQLHDVLMARSLEVGGPDRMRGVLVSGLVIGGPCIQRVALCWGSKGSNVTRLLKWKSARLDPSLKNMSASLMALHHLLLFRSCTIHFMDAYDRADDECNKERRQFRHKELESEETWTNAPDDWYDLLHSSP